MVTVSQSSMFNGFSYEALNEYGKVVGHFEFPWLAQASNARLRWHAPGSDTGDVQLLAQGVAYRVRHRYLSRKAHPDMRYSLLHGDELLGSADILQQPGLRRPEVRVDLQMLGQSEVLTPRMLQPTIPPLKPAMALLVRSSRRFGLRSRWCLRLGSRSIGTIEESAALMLRQTWVLRLPDSICLPKQLFLACLVRQLH